MISTIVEVCTSDSERAKEGPWFPGIGKMSSSCTSKPRWDLPPGREVAARNHMPSRHRGMNPESLSDLEESKQHAERGAQRHTRTESVSEPRVAFPDVPRNEFPQDRAALQMKSGITGKGRTGRFLSPWLARCKVRPCSPVAEHLPCFDFYETCY